VETAVIEHIGNQQAHYNASLTALEAVIAEATAEHFGGENPLLPAVQEWLVDAQRQREEFATWWKHAGQALEPFDEAARPVMPALPADEAARLLQQERSIFLDTE
jgi:hypothetical protein